MYTTRCVILSAAIGFTGIVSVEFKRPKTPELLITQSRQNPIIDPDDGGGRSFEQDKPRLDRFAKAMKENSSADAYIIAYGGLVSYNNEVRLRLSCIRKYLIATHHISRSRLQLIDGGYRTEVTVQLFLVKPGEPKPAAYPLVNREAVQMKNAPRYPCRGS